jgi:hypothetical protein
MQPYVGQISILLLATGVAVFTSAKSSDWNIMWAPAVYWPLFAIYVYFFAAKYKISWESGSLTMHASGSSERKILFGEITSIKSEVSSVGDVVAQSRPFRRVVVQGRADDPTARVDISLRHFDLRGIQELLDAIHGQRPDLEIPMIVRPRR